MAEVSDKLTRYSDETRAGFAEANDCTVRALSTVCKVPYADAHKWLETRGRRHGRGFDWISLFDGIAFGTVAATKDAFGYKVTLAYKRVVRWDKPTLAHMLAKYRTGSYVFITRNHALPVVDGRMIDTFLTGARTTIHRAYKFESTVDLEDEAKRRELRLRIEALEKLLNGGN